MKFNTNKFELLIYGKNEELKRGPLSFSAEIDIIEERVVLRDLGIQMNNQAHLITISLKFARL